MKIIQLLNLIVSMQLLKACLLDMRHSYINLRKNSEKIHLFFIVIARLMNFHLQNKK